MPRDASGERGVLPGRLGKGGVSPGCSDGASGPPLRAVGICLAAGAGSRMGGAKPARELVPGISLGSAVLSELAACGVERVVAVMRPGDDGMWLPDAADPGGAESAALAGRRPLIERADCSDADRGMAHSLRCGLAAAIGGSGDERRLGPNGMGDVDGTELDGEGMETDAAEVKPDADGMETVAAELKVDTDPTNSDVDGMKPAAAGVKADADEMEPYADEMKPYADEMKPGGACGTRLDASGTSPDVVLIALADQPFVDAALMRRLLARLAECPELDWTACGGADGTPVPPVALRSTMFGAVRRLSGDQGARKLLRDESFHGETLLDVPMRMLLDADIPEELERLRQAWKSMFLGRPADAAADLTKLQDAIRAK